MSVYKLYSTAIGDAAASVDITAKGKIVGVQWACMGDLNADGENYMAELSFSSVGGLQTNDTKSSFAAIKQWFGMLTSGAVATGLNHFAPVPDLPVQAGDRIYLHTAGTAIHCSAYVWVEDTAPETRRGRL